MPSNKYALLSVSDKAGIVNLANAIKTDYTILSTGGTAKVLRDAGVPITEISEFTGTPEMLEGRVKTLHPKVHGAILYRLDQETEAIEHGLVNLNLVVVNLYPFVSTVIEGHKETEVLEQIDIGGPTLIRAAAKNYERVAVLTSPDQYEDFLNRLFSNDITMAYRRQLASQAFYHVARYDAFISRYFNDLGLELLPATRQRVTLRYGENKHQVANYIVDYTSKPFVSQLHGKKISFNNTKIVE